MQQIFLVKYDILRRGGRFADGTIRLTIPSNISESCPSDKLLENHILDEMEKEIATILEKETPPMVFDQVSIANLTNLTAQFSSFQK